MTSPRKGKGPSKNDLEMTRIERRYSLFEKVAYGLLFIGGIAALAIPIKAFSSCIEPLAGNTTRIDMNLALGALFTVSLAINFGLTFKTRSQRTDLIRLRGGRHDYETDAGIEV